jgi:hypothetical protein
MTEIIRRADGHPVVIIPSTSYFARLHARLHRRLPMWVVYRPMTREYPGLWVTRMYVSLPAPKVTRFVMTHGTLPELRAMLPAGLTRLNRHPDDVPEIEEVWL